MHLSLKITLGGSPVTGVAPPVVNAYAQPDGTSLYIRPGGIYVYTQPDD